VNTAAWLLLLLSSIGSGAAVCVAIVVPRKRDLIWVPVAVLALAIALAALIAIARTAGRADTTIAASFIALGFVLGGFALASSFVPAATRLPAPDPPARVGTHDVRLRFILLADAEPEAYDPRLVTLAFDDLAGAEVNLPPDAARTFAYMAEKARYRATGVSPSRYEVFALAEHVHEALVLRGTDGVVIPAWTNTPPRLADVVAREVEDGARHFVVLPLEVSESRRTDLAYRELAALGLDELGVTVRCSPALWGSPEIGGAVAAHILTQLEDGPTAEDGVILTLPGQPDAWQRDYPAWIEQETYFVQRVRALLVDGGLAEDHVRMAYLDWQPPDVAEAARHLAAIGCRRIVVSPSVMPFDSLETLVDLRITAEQAQDESDALVIVVPAWGDDTHVAAAIAEEMTKTLGDGASGSGCGSGSA
jgi:protoheme ferro-lyase